VIADFWMDNLKDKALDGEVLLCQQGLHFVTGKRSGQHMTLIMIKKKGLNSRGGGIDLGKSWSSFMTYSKVISHSKIFDGTIIAKITCQTSVVYHDSFNRRIMTLWTWHILRLLYEVMGLENLLQHIFVYTSH